VTQKAYIAILGNASSFLNSVRESLAATREMQVGLNELAVSSRGAAEAQVAATVKKTARMREEVATYQAIAAASTRGSAEQIAATNLANRSQLRLAGSLGVSAREHEHLSRSTSGAERDLGRATRGALAGTGVFHTLGRSIAFASGGFLAFAGAGEFITKSISAARDAAVTQRQLGTQLRASGTSFDQWGGRIEQADLKLSHISGFTSDQLESSLTMLVRSTGNVNTALSLNSLAADVARGRHIGLTQAAVALGKAYTGNASALKRLGIEVPKGLSGMDALNIVSQKFAGQARAGATASQRFGAELHNSQIIIGTALLPTLNHYLAKGSDWLSQMNRSGKLQRDVTGATHTLAAAISGIKAIVVPAAHAFQLLGKAVGGTKREVELLALAFLGLKTRSKLIQWGFMTNGLGGVKTEAELASGSVGLLGGRLRGLKSVGKIVIPIIIASQVYGPLKSAWTSLFGDSAFKGIDKEHFVKVAGQTFEKGSVGELEARRRLKAARSGGAYGPAFGLGEAGDRTVVRSTVRARVTKAAAETLSPGQKIQIALAANPNDLTALREQAAFDQAQINAVKKRFAAGKLNAKDYTDALTKYEGDLYSQQSQIASILKDQATKTRDATKKSAAKAKTMLALPKHVAGSVSLLKDSFATSLRLQLAEAKAATTLTTADDAAVARQIKAAAQKALKSGKLAVQGQIDAWNAIAQANGTLGQQAKDALTGYRHVGANAITAGLHLSIATRKELDARIAQSQAHFGHAPTGAGVLGQQVTNVHGPVYVNADNPHQLTESLRKAGRHTAHQRRGHNAGARAIR